jgi:hypothetical protein
VLNAVRDKLMRKDLFEELCKEYTREMNRLRMEHHAGTAKAEREPRKLVQAIKDGISALTIKDELMNLEARKKGHLAECCARPKTTKVVGNRRPPGPNAVGCGGGIELS